MQDQDRGSRVRDRGQDRGSIPQDRGRGTWQLAYIINSAVFRFLSFLQLDFAIVSKGRK